MHTLVQGLEDAVIAKDAREECATNNNLKDPRLAKLAGANNRLNEQAMRTGEFSRRTNWQNNLALTDRPIGEAPKLQPLSRPDFNDNGKPFTHDEPPI